MNQSPVKTQDPVEKLGQLITSITSHPVAALPFLFSLAIGAVATIAAGFYGTFQLIVTIGARM